LKGVVVVTHELLADPSWVQRVALAHELGHVRDRRWYWAARLAPTAAYWLLLAAAYAVGLPIPFLLPTLASAFTRLVFAAEGEHRANAFAARLVGKRAVLDYLSGCDDRDDSCWDRLRAAWSGHPSTAWEVARVKRLGRQGRRV
jgi:Zn-dependent protease with chaperone function